jgi:hypothetical protein
LGQTKGAFKTHSSRTAETDLHNCKIRIGRKSIEIPNVKMKL